MAQVPQGFFTDVKNVGPLSGSPAFDELAFVSADDLVLYFTDASGAGTTPIRGGLGGADIWMATRSNTDEQFSNVTNLGPGVNSRSNDFMGSVSPDGQTLYFASDRDGLRGELYQAQWDPVAAQFSNVQSLGDGVNTEKIENGPRVSPDGRTLVYHVRDQGAERLEHDAWMATRESTNLPFENARRLEMNTAADDAWPSLSSDGLFLFTSDWIGIPPRPGGEGGEDIWVSVRSSTQSAFALPVNPDVLWPGSELNSRARSGSPFISANWPAHGSKIYWTATGPGRVSGSVDIFQATWRVTPEGDFSHDGMLDVMDIDLLNQEIREGGSNLDFDVNGDGTVDSLDRDMWVRELASTFFGDATLDGEFNSADLVAVFTAGKYEMDEKASWAEGDWTGDGRFGSGDLVAAFTDGGYEQGPRPAVAAVPEPASIFMLMIGLIGIAIRRRHADP